MHALVYYFKGKGGNFQNLEGLSQDLGNYHCKEKGGGGTPNLFSLSDKTARFGAHRIDAGVSLRQTVRGYYFSRI